MNVTVVTGHLTRPPDRRTLPSGEEVVSYDLSVVSGEDRAESVPVAWPAPPPSATQLDVGEALLVVGACAGGSSEPAGRPRAARRSWPRPCCRCAAGRR
jgi:hypothetical protein